MQVLAALVVGFACGFGAAFLIGYLEHRKDRQRSKRLADAFVEGLLSGIKKEPEQPTWWNQGADKTH